MLEEHARVELAHSRAPKSLRQLTLFDGLDSGRRRTAPQGSHKR
jgi:hypothetical protein